MDKKALGRHINRLRKAKGLTQADLEKASGVSSRSIQQIESGETNPGLETLESIAQALGTTLRELVDVASDGVKAKTARPESYLIKELIEAPEKVPHVAVSLVLEELLTVAPDIRAAVLAVLYGDREIALPYATPARKRAQGSK